MLDDKTNISADQYITVIKCPAFEDGKCRWVEGGPKELEKEDDCIYYKKVKDKNGQEFPSCGYNDDRAVLI